MSTTYADGRAALTALQAYLEAGLQQPPHRETFAQWRGVQVLKQDEERPAPREGRPQLVLALEDDRASTLFEVPGVRDATFTVLVRADEFSGSAWHEPGEGSDTLLSCALAQLLNEKNNEVRAAMRGIGFVGAVWQSGRESTLATAGAAQHADPHRVSFSYQTPGE